MGLHMSAFFLRSETLDTLAKRKDIQGSNGGWGGDSICDASVTITYGGDGVMLPEIFDSGAQLMVEAAGRPIWLVWDTDREQMFFFIGDLADVMKKVEACPDLAGETEIG